MRKIKRKQVIAIILGVVLVALLGFILRCYSWQPGRITEKCGTTPWLTELLVVLEGRRMVLMYDNRGELEKYLKELAKDPNNCSALGQVAVLYSILEEWDEAAYAYESTILKCPRDTRSRFWLGVTYYITGRTELGLQHMQAAIQLAADLGDKDTETILRDEMRFFLEKARKNELPELRLGKLKVTS